MDFVEPFKDVQQIDEIKKDLKQHSERDFLLFVMGINTGMKISDMLVIKAGDVVCGKNKIKTFYEIPCEESVRQKEIYFNSKVRSALEHYLNNSGLSPNDYIYASLKTKNPISRQQAHRIIHDAIDRLGIKGKFGASSMRKTFGYHAYKKGVSISIIQEHYHHATPSETYKYLGITKEEPARSIIDVNL
ncbi:site-specific recombinase XerD [Peribacillus deserti]|uniref:Site-specific recombinase XerD n=1 Tax=Peribacillus deserti TaxID=673318 RepID=A0ABS2QMX5_9BACI|nr:tyrosine-type recombinase/integrase [Peribacillus deserti]MBM7694522.1 site-specific recombinase XerD [Peribacillus deserti]